MSIEPPPSFGALLRHYRRAAGLTQEELAERAGLSRGAINTLERGARHTPRKETLALLAEALALGPDDRTALTLAGRRAPSALLTATPATGAALDGHNGHNGHADAAATLPRGTVTLPSTDAWPWLRANLALAGVLTLILVALAGLLLPLVVPTFPRAIGLVAGGAALALLVAGGVAALVWQRAQAPGTPWSQVVTHSLAALWRTTKRSGPGMLSVLLTTTLVGTTLYITRPTPFTLPELGGYDFSYTYHAPTHRGGSAVIWTNSPIYTLTTPALNDDWPFELYRAVWNTCLVRLPDLKLPSLEGWKADQCTRVPTVANRDEDESGRWTIFHIDPQARWSDGQPLTADDFLFTIRLIRDPNVFGSMIGPGPPDPLYPPWSLMQLSKLDPNTVRIDWSKPYYDYLTALARLYPLPLHEYMSGPFAGVFNPTTGAYNSALARRMATQFSFNLSLPVDNGPFVVSQVIGYPRDYQSTVCDGAPALVLTRNPKFFSNFFHAPALDQVTFKSHVHFPHDPHEGEQLIDLYRQGGVTVADRMGPVDFAYLHGIPTREDVSNPWQSLITSLSGIPVGEVASAPGQVVLSFAFNQRTAAPNARLNGGTPIFTDASVRRAFVEAYDRCGALRAALGLRDCHDRNFVTDEPTAPSNPDYDPSVTLPAFNPIDAAKLLDRAGFPVVRGIRRFRDRTTPLTLTVSSSFATEAYQSFVRSLQQDYYRYLQIDVRIETSLGGLSGDSGLTGAFDIGILTLNVGPDSPANMIRNTWDYASIPNGQNGFTINIFGLIDPWMVTQRELAANTGDEAQRSVIYKEMTRHVAEQLYFLPVLNVTDITLVTPTLCNFKKWPAEHRGGYLWNMADWYLASGSSCP